MKQYLKLSPLKAFLKRGNEFHKRSFTLGTIMQYLDERVGPEASFRAWIPNLNFLKVDGSGGKVGLLLFFYFFFPGRLSTQLN